MSFSPLQSVRRLALAVFSLACIFATAQSAHAGVILGGSSLLSPTDLAQLEAWLGEGQLTLTNIFTKDPTKPNRNDSLDFHLAVDGQGRTFTVMSVVDPDGADVYSGLVGGYNPRSWSQIGSYNTSNSFAARTAFLFNLTSDTLFPQQIHDRGFFQTFNLASYGPTFGAGHDLWVNATLTVGYSCLYSYHNLFSTCDAIAGGHYDSANMAIGGLEVFSIAPYAAVPEPGMLALLSIGFLGVVAVRRRAR